MDFFDARDNDTFMCVEETRNFQFSDHVGSETEIQRFFANKNVLITGATGLIGGRLVERLLRSCPKIGKIYLLVRTKSGKSAEERVQELINSEVFHKVKKIHPDIKFATKLIKGDLNQPSCGLSEDHQQILVNDIHVVYHIATCKLNLMRGNVFQRNTKATQNLLELAMKIKYLKAFIYVSPVQIHMKEQFYEMKLSEDEIHYFKENLHDREFAAITPKICGHQEENKYVFTQAIPEMIIERYMSKIPLAVVKLNNVVCSDKEYLITWWKNVPESTKVSLRESISFWTRGISGISDITPADQVVNTIIAVGWHIGTNTLNGNKMTMPVYNISTNGNRFLNKVVLENLTIIYQVIIKHFGESSIYLADLKWTPLLNMNIFRIISEIMTDLFLKCIRITQKLLEAVSFMNLDNKPQKFWLANHRNVEKLWTLMSNSDRKIFTFYKNNYEWDRFYSRSIRGVVSNLVQDEFNNMSLPKRNKKIKKFLQLSLIGIGLYMSKGFLLLLLKLLNTIFV